MPTTERVQPRDPHEILTAASSVIRHLIDGQFKLILELEVPARVRVDGADHLTHTVTHHEV